MRFIADSMLGSLAKWLRIFGYDALYDSTWNKEKMINLGLREDRTILTKDTSILKKLGLKILFVTGNSIEEQLKCVIKNFSLKIDEEMLFTRCTICNVLSKIIPREEIKDKVPPFVYQTQNEFRVCPKCNRIYWAGTHIDSVRKMLDAVISHK